MMAVLAFVFRGGELGAKGRGAAMKTSACASHAQRRLGAPRPGQTINDGGARGGQLPPPGLTPTWAST
jgi:hypothetical protein